MSMVKKKKWAPVVVLLAFLVPAALFGCSGSNSNEAGNMDTAAPEAAQSTSSDAKYAENLTVADQAAGFYGSSGAANAAEPAMDASGNSDDGSFAAFDRKLIYRANLTMEVEDYAAVQSRIRDMVALSDGYILEFSDSKTAYEQTGNFVIRVPAQGFFSFIDQLRVIQPQLQQSVKGQDFTEEYVDLSSRLKAKRLVEERLSSFMQKATRADDLLQFSNQLATVQEEIERIEGRIRYIDQNVDYSTIELRVYQRLNKNAVGSKTDAPFGEQILDAMKSSAEFVSRFLQGLVIVVAALLPVLAVLALICVPLLYWYLKKRAPASRKAKRGREAVSGERANENRADREAVSGERAGESRPDREAASGERAGESRPDRESASGERAGESRADREAASGERAGESRADREAASGERAGESDAKES